MYLEGIEIDYIETIEGADSSSTTQREEHLRLRQLLQRLMRKLDRHLHFHRFLLLSVNSGAFFYALEPIRLGESTGSPLRRTPQSLRACAELWPCCLRGPALDIACGTGRQRSLLAARRQHVHSRRLVRHRA